MNKIIVHSGIEVVTEANELRLTHPYTASLTALRIILNKEYGEYYSNSPDFVSAIKYMGEKYNVETEFTLDGESTKNEIEKQFHDFNRSFDVINEHSLDEDEYKERKNKQG